MQLRFLGAAYSRQWPSIETTEGEMTGKYRGVAWCAKQHHPATIPSQSVTLRFLGRSYQTRV